MFLIVNHSMINTYPSTLCPSYRPTDFALLFISLILTCSALLNGAIWTTSRARHKPYWFCPKPVNQRRYIYFFPAKQAFFFFYPSPAAILDWNWNRRIIPFLPLDKNDCRWIRFRPSSYIIALNLFKREANFFLMLLSRTCDKYLSYCIS